MASQTPSTVCVESVDAPPVSPPSAVSVAEPVALGVPVLAAETDGAGGSVAVRLALGSFLASVLRPLPPHPVSRSAAATTAAAVAVPAYRAAVARPRRPAAPGRL
ncbi:hypothetical protein [Streptomyces sp. NBC_00448]|uniref:hypothetical protein n=1 Tax=Streptomyces sp. NBC_00448 TaxID=2903652 RepID=UPI002E212CC6